MNFSALSNRTVLGRLLRLPLNLLPKDLVVPIIQGPLRGRRWIVGASNHGCWLGSYEQPKAAMFLSRIKPGAVVYDWGANAGFYTLLAAAAVEGSGMVYAFEPLPSNLVYLREHLLLNNLLNVRVVSAAVSNLDGTAEFLRALNSSMGGLAEVSGGSQLEKLTVETIQIDRAVRDGKLRPPDIIKCDVEGAEMLALLGAHETLSRYSPEIFLATHGADIHRQCVEYLRGLNYTVNVVEAGGSGGSEDELYAFKRK